MVTNPAGFWVRLGAFILDGLIIGIPLAILGFLVTGGVENNSITSSLGYAYTLILPIVWFGYTIGKKICGIRIVKVNGEKLGVGAMLLRTFVAGIIYGITFGIAGIITAFMIGLRKDKRAIHDLIAGTYVTYEKP
ncbi:RDD family protein [Bacillus sp. FSL K6-3431]|uniref:RDD family protein n=1 Tax=Bacillus sp. FSL K6-3431 TaxID=2921500 RepID=UPI0030F71204